MLSKSQIQFIKSLKDKKNREECKVFTAEGNKLVEDLLKEGAIPSLIAGTPEWLHRQKTSLPDGCQIIISTKDNIEKASNQKTPQEVIAVFHQPGLTFNWNEALKEGVLFCLDGIQNPGNLGTILRSADWFGFTHILASPETADLFNPKVVQASMGAVLRVKVKYTSLAPFFEELRKEARIPLYGTFMDGQSIFSEKLRTPSIVLIGNEGEGISRDIEPLIDKKISIPPFPLSGKRMESLNAGVASSILMAEFRRQSCFQH